MKRTSIRKKGKSSVSKIQQELWELCKQITRKKYGNTCFTCDKTGLEGSNWHTSHFLPKASCGAFLKYDLRNLRPACYFCNICLGGNAAEYYRRLLAIEGQEYVDQIFKDKQKIIKASDHYVMLLVKYRKMLAKMLST